MFQTTNQHRYPTKKTTLLVVFLHPHQNDKAIPDPCLSNLPVGALAGHNRSLGRLSVRAMLGTGTG